MPSLTLQITQMGPLVTVYLLPSAPRIQALKAANQPVPHATTGLFLIDTGASSTVVDPTVLTPLNLTPTGQVGFHTPSTNGSLHTCNQYDVQLTIPAGSQAPFVVPALAVMETNLAAQGIAGLIGRDVLSKCILVYNGTVNLYSLSY